MSEEHGRSLTDWLGITNAPNWSLARPLGRVAGAILVVAVPLLFFGALLAAGFVLYHTVSLVIHGSKEGISLGVGALVAALLGAPFLIWGTVLKHQTVMFQKEGHMTDRINKAVEQLGAEKKVDRIGRVLRLYRGNSAEGQYEKAPPASVLIAESKPKASVGSLVVEKTNSTYRVYEREEVVIEWKDTPFPLEAQDYVADSGGWQVLSETVPSIEVRIGAILSLERIAQDSTRHDKGRDHVRVMEILCAYIRENSNATSPQDHPFGEWKPLRRDANEGQVEQHIKRCFERFGNVTGGGKISAWALTLPKPRADVSLALKVLGRRTETQRRIEAAWPNYTESGAIWPFDVPPPKLLHNDKAKIAPRNVVEFEREINEWKKNLYRYRGYRLDLRGANLQNADFSSQREDGAEAIFSGARFENARLEGARMDNVRLEGALLINSRLDAANLREARLSGAALLAAHLEGTNLFQAEMLGTTLIRARMENSDLRNCNFDGAYCDEARLEWSSIDGATFELVEFHRMRTVPSRP